MSIWTPPHQFVVKLGVKLGLFVELLNKASNRMAKAWIELIRKYSTS